MMRHRSTSRSTLVRAALAAALGLGATGCHSFGTYFEDAEPMPLGPGVVDCFAFGRTENAYVHTGTWTPVAFTFQAVPQPVDPRAPRGARTETSGSTPSGTPPSGASPAGR